MKDSGIEWIGEIPESWVCCKQKYFIQLINGRAYSDSEFETDGKYRILRVGNLFSNPTWYTSSLELSDDKYCDNGDLLYSWSMSYAPVIWRGEKVIYHYHIWKVVLNDTLEKQFVYYYFIALTDALRAEVHEITMSFITMGIMNNSFIAFPPLPEQQAISAYLDRQCTLIDSVTEKTKASIEEYKKLRQAVITQAVTKGVRGDRPMKDSGIEWIGEIPEEWARATAHRIVTDTQNGLTRRDLDKSEGQIVLKLKNITASGEITYNEINRIELSDDELARYSLQDGDFLFVRVNGTKALVGKCALYKALDEPVAYNDHIIRVRLNDMIQKRYFQYYLLSNAGRTEIDLRTSTAAGQYTISGEGLRNILILLPSIIEQVEIITYLDQKCAEIDALIAKKETFLAELEAYKKSVIYEYVTGKKEVLPA